MQKLPLYMVYNNIIYLQYLSSHKNGDYNSCNAENNEINCLICNPAAHRILLLSPGPSKCICEHGWFDVNQEECKQCYYTWLIYIYIIELYNSSTATIDYNSCNEEL